MEVITLKPGNLNEQWDALTLRPRGRDYYVRLEPGDYTLNRSWALRGFRVGLTVEAIGSTIRAEGQITGAALDLTGSTGVRVSGLNLRCVGARNSCFAGVVVARTPANESSGQHRFHDCQIVGNWTHTAVYNVASEVNVWNGSRVENHLGPYGVVLSYHNRLSLTGVGGRASSTGAVWNDSDIMVTSATPGAGAAFMIDGFRGVVLGGRTYLRSKVVPHLHITGVGSSAMGIDIPGLYLHGARQGHPTESIILEAPKRRELFDTHVNVILHEGSLGKYVAKGLGTFENVVVSARARTVEHGEDA